MEEKITKKENIQSYSGWAIGGFIVGLFSIPILSPLAVTGAIPVLAIILSGMGLSQVKKKNKKGRGLAIAGLLFAIIGIIYTGYILFFVV
ncbi:MAG: DUF4190 domain-containing protein [Candidatus Kerfeldbacteria bacterium]